MNATKHLRVLAYIYLAIGAPTFVLAALVFVWASTTSGEGALLMLPAGAVAIVGFPLLLAGLGLRSGASWGVALAVMCALPMFVSIVFTPLALYTFFVAYVRWSQPTELPGHPPADLQLHAATPDAPPAAFVAREIQRPAGDLRLPATLWLLAGVFPLYVLVVILSERLPELLFSIALAPVAAYTLLTAGGRWKKPLERHAGAVGLPHRSEVMDMIRHFERPNDTASQARMLASIWLVAAILPLYIVVTLWSAGQVEMLVSLLLAPVAAYTCIVTYLWFTGPYDGAAGIPDQPHRAEVAEAARRIAWPTSARAHVRILSTLWILGALVPFYIGGVMLMEGLAELPENGLYSFGAYAGTLFLFAGAAAVALARALQRQHRAALVSASACSFLIIHMWPLGTMLTAYTLWTAYLVFRAQRETTPPSPVAEHDPERSPVPDP